MSTGPVAAMKGKGPVLVRTFHPADAPALRRLRGQADAVHARLLPDYFRAPADESRPVPARDPSSEVLVAEGPGQGGGPGQGIAGYVVVKVVETPPDPTMTPCRRAHVDIVVVDEAARRTGVGKALMRAADHWAGARGCGELVLTVWSDNRDAEAFYRAIGYEPIARVLRKSVAAT